MKPPRPFALTRREFVVAAGTAILATPQTAFGATEAVDTSFGAPEDVAIKGYDGDAMEPFLSRDAKLLLFNNRNTPPEETDLHWAERIDDLTFAYRGRIEGANSSALDGVPSMDESGELFFVSTRSYGATFSTLYRAQFSKGITTTPVLVEGVSRREPGWVNFDAEISQDGTLLVFVDSWFGSAGHPLTAELVLAQRAGDKFVRRDDSAALLAAVNGTGLAYAPALSPGGRELFFTRVEKIAPGATPAIYRAISTGSGVPFGMCARIGALEGFVEAPSLSPDGRLLYFHAKMGDRYRVRLSRRDRVPASP